MENLMQANLTTYQVTSNLKCNNLINNKEITSEACTHEVSLLRRCFLVLIISALSLTNTINAQCTGNATAVTSQTGVDSPNETLGALDMGFAKLFSTNDNITLDLGAVIPAGTTIGIVWQKSGGGNAIISVASSAAAASGFVAVSGSPFTETNTNYNTVNVTLPADAQYININNDNGKNFKLDGLSFTCPAGIDTDNDGIPDDIDLDDDNDGIPDLVECPGYGPELVVNGDFEDAYANWTSDFNRGINNNAATSGGCSAQGWVAISPCATVNGSCSDYYSYNGGTFDGTTLITDSYGTGANVLPTTTCNSTVNSCLAESLADHTSGTGFSVYIDPSDITGKAYWKQTVSVEAGKEYQFSMWIMVIEEDPNLEFKVNGTSLTGGVNLNRLTGGSDGTDIWQEVVTTWDSGTTSGNVVLELVNLTAGCNGNDIRIDDISFRTILSCDSDGDGLADNLDLDADNDGIPDLIEAGGTDINGDGLVDYPTAGDPTSMVDIDNDGLADVYDTEDTAGGTSGWTNGTAVPNIDSDKDGLPNTVDLDSDNDGITDVVENAGGNTNSDNGGSGALSGTVNGYTDATDNNGWNDSSTTAITDTDGDGIPDYLDIDADNDGIVDYLEGVCSNCPTFGTPTGPDSDGNGVLDIYENMSADNTDNVNGNNIGSSPNVDDNSGNTTPDYLDTDADNDGANDWTEGYDLNNDGKSSDDLILMAEAYETANANNFYDNTMDSDADGIPDWLDNQPNVSGHNETARPPFLDPNSAYWYDVDNDGLVDLFDASENGTDAPTPDNNGGDDLDWRDNTTVAALPVELISFKGLEENCEVLLSWASASEDNFKFYEVQVSKDGSDFTILAAIEGSGSANGATYRFIDEQPSTKNYYRLKMIDLDGTFEYSEMIIVTVECEENGTLSVYPNPVAQYDGVLNVVYQAFDSEEQFTVTDMTGRKVMHLNIPAEKGMKNSLRLDISDLPKGAYYLTQLIENRNITSLFIVQE